MTIFLSAPAVHAQEALPTLVVLADNSLGLPLSRIARDYAKTHDAMVTVTLAGGREETTLINEGAAVDMLITAKMSTITLLRQQGLVDLTAQAEVAHNRLALAGPADGYFTADFTRGGFPLAAWMKAAGDEPRLVLGNPENLSEGSYARESLRKLGSDGDLEPYTVYVRSHADMREMITRRGAYAIMYQTDAQRYRGLRIAGLMPVETHQPITYTAMVLAGDQMDQARSFLKFLQTKEARALLEAYGFTTPEQKPAAKE